MISPVGFRKDGRCLSQPRKLICSLGRLSGDYAAASDSGAASVQMGNTKVLAQVIDNARTSGGVTVDITWAPGASIERRLRRQTDRLTGAYALAIQKAFDELIGGSNKNVFVQVTVLGIDGAVLAACINAVSLSLIRAGVPLNDMLSAASGVYLEDRQVLDPTANEASNAVAELTLGVLERSKQISILVCESKVSAEVMQQLISMTMEECERNVTILREAVRQHLDNATLSSQILSNKIVQVSSSKETKKTQEI